MNGGASRSLLRSLILAVYRCKFALLRYSLFRVQANTAHELIQDLFERWDQNDLLQGLLRRIGNFLRPQAAVTVGGVELPQPFMLAAGWCKGEGYDNEVQALGTVVRDGNLLPGWRTLPHLAGAVEFGSYTRWPRQGNQGRTLFRYPAARGLGNRIGLRNAGIRAVASFLALHRDQLPPVWGINLASTPGEDDPATLRREIGESLAYLEDARLTPSWLTLNVSCPTGEEAADLKQTVEPLTAVLEGARAAVPGSLPLWLKVSPCLTARQYEQILLLAVQFGVRAIVATNTRQERDAADGFHWGASGGLLTDDAWDALRKLVTLKRLHQASLDIVACGGIRHGRDVARLRPLQVNAWQYHTAMIYRGPLAGVLIHRESRLAAP